MLSTATVWRALLDTWLLTLGVPNAVMADMGGEFEREVKEELETMGSKIISSAPYSPTQNAICERHGQTWKAHERALISEFFLSFKAKEQVRWLTAAINYAVNSAAGLSGCSGGSPPGPGPPGGSGAGDAPSARGPLRRG